jgi:hypothetical protein
MKFLVLEFSPVDGFLVNYRLVKSESEMLQLVAITAASMEASVRVHATRDEHGLESIEVSKALNETETLVVAKRADDSPMIAMDWAKKLAKEKDSQLLETALENQVFALGLLAKENVALMQMH